MESKNGICFTVKCFMLCFVFVLAGFVYADPPETWTFVSIPDFVNTDLGTLAGYPGYPDGWADSTTAGFEATLASYLDAIAAENPDLVLVAGDLVEGEWHHDKSGRNIFGTYGTHANREIALDNAANLYYSQWLDRFDSRGLAAYPCVGDHELGDNDWGTGSNRARLVPNFKAAFARHFTLDSGSNHKFPMRPVGTPYEDTSYAFQNKNILFITIDVWRQDSYTTKLDNRTGSVLATVGGAHLAWLDSVLTAADSDPTIDHVIVQAHSPVLTPIRVRGSSELYLRDYDGTTNAANADQGADTDFWQTLAAHDVDFFFAGEVHHNTLSISDSVIQIVHDGIPYSSGNFLLATVTGKKIDFEIKHVDIGQGTEKFWQTSQSGLKTEIVVQGSSWETVATATFDKSTGTKVLSNMTGELIPYGTNDGSIEGVPPPPYTPNWDFEDPDISGTDVLSSVTNWNTLRSDDKAHFDDKGSEGRVPGTGSNQVIRLRTGWSTGTIRRLDMPHKWASTDIMKLSFNASEVYWHHDDVGNEITVSLKQSDWIDLWTAVIPLDGTHDGVTNSDWTPAQTFSFTIDASTFSGAGVVEGSGLLLEFKSTNQVNWIDNVQFCCSKADLNCSGIVDVDDLAYMASVWLTADLTADIMPGGNVNLFDFSILSQEWGR